MSITELRGDWKLHASGGEVLELTQELYDNWIKGKDKDSLVVIIPRTGFYLDDCKFVLAS